MDILVLRRVSHHRQQVQQGISSEWANSQTNAELNTELEDSSAGGAQQHHNAKHGQQRYHYIGQSCIEVTWKTEKVKNTDWGLKRYKTFMKTEKKQ